MLSEFITFEPDRLREASLGDASFLGSKQLGPQSGLSREASPTLPLILPEEWLQDQQEGRGGFGGSGSGQASGTHLPSVGVGCIFYGLEVGAYGRRALEFPGASDLGSQIPRGAPERAGASAWASGDGVCHGGGQAAAPRASAYCVGFWAQVGEMAE